MKWLSRKYEREWMGFALSLTNISRTDKKIDFASTDYQYVADLGDMRKLYQLNDPGKEFAISRPVIFNEYSANHLLSDSLRKERIPWIETNINQFLRALISPDLIEKTLRKRKDGYFSATHIVDLGKEKTDSKGFMAVAISLSKDLYNGYHQITTIYPRTWRNIYNSDGTLREKYIRTSIH
ncbi:MAG: hypothetical protein ACOX7C_08675 [Brevefilum sp.]